MNLILLYPQDRLHENLFAVDGARAQHLREVLGAEPGKRVRVGLLEGPTGSASVVRMEANRVELQCVFESTLPERPLVDLVLAVPRPKSLRKLLPEVCAMGIARLILIRTWRVAKPYLTAQILTPEEYRPLLHEGLMQGRCTREPEVLLEPLFKPFVEDRAPELFGQHAVCLVGHPTAERPIASVKVGTQDRVAICVGPEGGLLPYEVDALEAVGFTPVSMGERPLRVETACVALLAQVELLRQQSALQAKLSL